MRDRQVTGGLDDFGHGHAEPVLDDDDLPARDQPLVDEDIDRLADAPVEFQHRAGHDLQEVADGDRDEPSTAETVTGTSKTCSRSSAVLTATGPERATEAES
jgi:hypothetical protein